MGTAASVTMPLAPITSAALTPSLTFLVLIECLASAASALHGNVEDGSTGGSFQPYGVLTFFGQIRILLTMKTLG